MPGKSDYTEEEKDLLQELVRKYKNFVECKKSNAVSLQAKSKAWERLCDDYNSMPNVRPRTVKQLRKWWDNLKQKWKKEKAKEVRGSMGTGKSTCSVNQRSRMFQTESLQAVDHNVLPQTKAAAKWRPSHLICW